MADGDDSDHSNDTATFVTVGTETFVTTCTAARDDVDLADWDIEPTEYRPQSQSATQEPPQPAHAREAPELPAPRAPEKVKVTDAQIEEALSDWITETDAEGVEGADLFLGNMNMEDPEGVLAAVSTAMHKSMSERRLVVTIGKYVPHQLFLNSNSLTELPKAVWTLVPFQSLRQLFLQDNMIQEVPVGFFEELPQLALLNLEENLIEQLPAPLIDSMIARPTFELRLHRNSSLISPPLAVTGCANPMDNARLKAMQTWWTSQPVQVTSTPNKPVRSDVDIQDITTELSAERESEEGVDGEGQCRGCASVANCTVS